MEDIQLQEAIERYLTDQMSVEERTQFEAIRKTTPGIDQMVIELLERETLVKEDIDKVFAKVKPWPKRPAWTGSARRQPSSTPPVRLQPKAAAPEVVEEKAVRKPKPKKTP